MGKMKKYTVGFIFNPILSKVLLIRKERPEWQKGKLNGVGGKIEQRETSKHCIVREVAEECGLQTKDHEWTRIGKMRGADWFCDVYTHVHQGSLNDVSTTTDEEVQWFPVHKLPKNILTNLPWLIHLSLDKIKHDKFHQCVIRYK